ncbi:MAG: cupin domain-containing protein [Candidatus Odinarchaeia archaeon]
MYINVDEIELESFEMEGARGTYLQWILDNKGLIRDHIIHRTIIKSKGEIPSHLHDWYHIVYVLNGNGLVGIGEKTFKIAPNVFLYIPPNVEHWVVNKGNTDLILLVISPIDSIKSSKSSSKEIC